jgi:ElaB/YqjD/DUF883 family membrane-anchored ribosome-binding protein
MSEASEVISNQQLANDLKDAKGLIADATEKLRVFADAAGDKMGGVYDDVRIKLRDAKERVEDAQAIVIDKTKDAARATDDFVHDEPWKAVGIAAGVGLVLGLLIGRR